MVKVGLIASLFSMFILAGSATGAGKKNEIKLKSHLKFQNQKPVVLKDLVMESSFPIPSELSNIRLSDGPSVGERRTFTSRGIAETLRIITQK